MIRPALAATALLTLASSAAAIGPKLPEVDDPPAHGAAAEGPKVEFRANQINRCVDAGGRVRLQDTPCSPAPVPTGAAATSAPSDGVVDLAALPSRAADRAGAAPAHEPAGSSLSDLALSASWKLALAVAFAYGVYRALQAWRQSYAIKEGMTQPPRRTR